MGRQLFAGDLKGTVKVQSDICRIHGTHSGASLVESSVSLHESVHQLWLISARTRALSTMITTISTSTPPGGGHGSYMRCRKAVGGHSHDATERIDDALKPTALDAAPW